MSDQPLLSIPLTQGQIALIDEADFGLVDQFRWHAHYDPTGHRFYAVTLYSDDDHSHHSILMHRLILDAPPNRFVDHIDGNGLHNSRSNLRLATPLQNSFNTRPHRDGSSKFKGVHLTNKKYPWRARIKVDGKAIQLGYFSTEDEAAHAYDIAATKFFGAHAWLNFAEPT